MAASRTGLFALLILAVLVVVSWKVQSSSDQDSRDANTAYCLAPGHEEGLVNSAASLGLVGSGSSPSAIRLSHSVIPLTLWRSKDGDAFQRACDADAAPAVRAGGPSGQGGGPGALLTVLLPAVAGALLTLTINEITQGSDRRWVQADALRESWNAFRGTVEAYVAKKPELNPGTLPTPEEIARLRRDLETKLRVIQSQHRKSPTVAGLRGQLTAELGTGVTEGWAAGATEDAFQKRRDQATAITGQLDNFDSSLQKVAGKLEHRIWLSWRL